MISSRIRLVTEECDNEPRITVKIKSRFGVKESLGFGIESFIGISPLANASKFMPIASLLLTKGSVILKAGIARYLTTMEQV